MRLTTVMAGLSKKRVMATLALGLVLGLSSIPSADAILEKKAAGKTAADYFVHSLPGQPEGPLLKMHAGHIEITPEDHGNLFFWHFENRHLADKPRTVIWINGGPGCSSEDGALMEIGPYRVREGGNLEYNNGSWDEFANLLFVDNPVGTGFSYVDSNKYLHELQEMADQFVLFLEKFFALFPHFMHDDIYIAGESYAGVHIPYIARTILDRNKDSTKEPWNLQGLLIGNGWISPADQYLSYLPFAYKSGLIQGGTNEAKVVETQQAICVNKLDEGGKDHIDTPHCEEIMQKILDVTQNKKASADQRCANMYDVRLRDSFPSCGMNWPPDLKDVTPYLRRPDVVAALHVDGDKKTGWQECNGLVGGAFRAHKSRPSIELLPGLLSELPIVLFSGDQDLICNHIGTEELINNLQWNGAKGMELSPGTWAPRREWTFENEAAGIYQEARNLTYVLFYNSSHMVPFDYPRRTRDMLDRFLGVDIASIGGTPADSRIDGEKGIQTSVGAHPNSTAAEEETAKKVDDAVYNAYYRSGEVALVIVGVAAALWGWFVWRERRKTEGYQGLLPVIKSQRNRFGGRGNNAQATGGLETFRDRRRGRDVEAADFDENELDEFDSDSDAETNAKLTDKSNGQKPYSIGDDSDTSEDRPLKEQR